MAVVWNYEFQGTVLSIATRPLIKFEIMNSEIEAERTRILNRLKMPQGTFYELLGELRNENKSIGQIGDDLPKLEQVQNEIEKYIDRQSVSETLKHNLREIKRKVMIKRIQNTNGPYYMTGMMPGLHFIFDARHDRPRIIAIGDQL